LKSGLGYGVEDGFEYKSAVDLNNDDYQAPNESLPFPGKTPYPNPLFKDSDVDYDGDVLTVSEEYALWKYTYTVNHTSARTLTPLSYSDGTQYSLSTLTGGNGVRVPTQTTASYQPPASFRAWADLSGYRTIMIYSPVIGRLNGGDPHVRAAFDIYDMNHSTVTTPGEMEYWDYDGDNYVSDDERDEDADGLTNYDETHGPASGGWWAACYNTEGPFPIKYAGTKAFDADSDGDGVLDGADDQDFDDVPNIMELSRSLAGNVAQQASCAGTAVYNAAAPPTTWVNPFNPCLPDEYSRSCPRHPAMDAPYPPFKPGWIPMILN
jgi:hypothetical protein